MDKIILLNRIFLKVLQLIHIIRTIRLIKAHNIWYSMQTAVKQNFWFFLKLSQWALKDEMMNIYKACVHWSKI